MSRLAVLYQSSALYCIPAAISLCSLFENNKAIDELELYFVDDGIWDIDREELKNLAARYGRIINYIDASNISEIFEKAGAKKWKGSYTTFLKLLAVDMIPEDKVLYIDSDTIVCDSLEELCNYELGESVFGMVDEIMVKDYMDYLGITRHYNGGVILFNLEQYRKLNIKERILESLADEKFTSKNSYADQSLINQVFADEICRIPAKYNVHTSMWLFWDYKKSVSIYHGYGEKTPYSKNEYLDAFNNPAILHYTLYTTDRPWIKGNSYPFVDYYNKYCEMLNPWRPVDDSLFRISRVRKLYLLVIGNTPRKVRRITGWRGFCMGVLNGMNFKDTQNDNN